MYKWQVQGPIAQNLHVQLPYGLTGRYNWPLKPALPRVVVEEGRRRRRGGCSRSWRRPVRKSTVGRTSESKWQFHNFHNILSLYQKALWCPSNGVSPFGVRLNTKEITSRNKSLYIQSSFYFYVRGIWTGKRHWTTMLDWLGLLLHGAKCAEESQTIVLGFRR